LTLGEMVAAMRRGEGRRPGLLPVPAALVAATLKTLGRHGDWERLGGDLVADPGKLLSAGWRPPVATHDGLAAMAQAASPRKSGTASPSTL
jgi:UDP-glucose 4-epimerase